MLPAGGYGCGSALTTDGYGGYIPGAVPPPSVPPTAFRVYVRRADPQSVTVTKSVASSAIVTKTVTGTVTLYGG